MMLFFLANQLSFYGFAETLSASVLQKPSSHCPSSVFDISSLDTLMKIGLLRGCVSAVEPSSLFRSCFDHPGSESLMKRFDLCIIIVYICFALLAISRFSLHVSLCRSRLVASF